MTEQLRNIEKEVYDICDKKGFIFISMGRSSLKPQTEVMYRVEGDVNPVITTLDEFLKN